MTARDAPAVPYIVVCVAGEAGPPLAEGLRGLGRVESADSLLHAAELLALTATACFVVEAPGDARSRATLGQIAAAYPETRVVALAESLPFEAARDLVRLGVRDVLPLSVEPSGCADAVRRLLAGDAAAPEGLRGTSVAVASGKGGAGCTVLTLHLAAVLAEDGTALALDADAPPFGALTAAADSDPPSSVAGLLRQRLPVEPRVLRRAAEPHRAGFSIVPLWTAAGDAAEVENVVTAVLDACTTLSPFVVIDVGRPVLPAQRLLLRRAGLVVAVTALDLLSLRGLRHLMDLVAGETGGAARVLPVLNRTDSEASYTPEQAAAAIGQPFAAVLPHSPALQARTDRGELMVAAGPGDAWATAARRLAQDIVARRRDAVRTALV